MEKTTFCDNQIFLFKFFCWCRHLLTHTGEEMFHCTSCQAQMKTKSEHDAKVCKTSVVNVFESNEDGSLVGFMCNECNYIQVSRGRLIKHLENEHGYQHSSEPHNFREWVLVKTNSNWNETNEHWAGACSILPKFSTRYIAYKKLGCWNYHFYSYHLPLVSIVFALASSFQRI